MNSRLHDATPASLKPTAYDRLLAATAGALSLSPAALARALGTAPIPLCRQPNGALAPDLLAVRRLLAARATPAFQTIQSKDQS